jgi:hypothetical protein
MRTTPDFITGMAKHSKSTEFACYVRNYTSNAVRLKIPFGRLERAERMTLEQQAQIVAGNRQRYAAERDQPRTAATEPGSPPPTTAPASLPPTDDWRS